MTLTWIVCGNKTTGKTGTKWFPSNAFEAHTDASRSGLLGISFTLTSATVLDAQPPWKTFYLDPIFGQ